ncbi:MAG TPA: hypothetical protein DHV36_23095, partial [Desulfobacteraceae bacterium]|nr:hypothetical protein [Desulfobacteraceae bacterium]
GRLPGKSHLPIDYMNSLPTGVRRLALDTLFSLEAMFFYSAQWQNLHTLQKKAGPAGKSGFLPGRPAA